MRAQNVCTCLLVPWLWGWATFTLLPTSTHHRHQTWLDVSVLSHPLMCSWPLSNTSNAWRFAKAVHLHFSYEELIPCEAVKHLSRVLWPLQPVQSNPLMTMTESDEPTPSSLCHKDFQSCSQTQDLHDEIPSSYGAQGRILWRRIFSTGTSLFACALAFFSCLSERFSNGWCMRLSSLAENLSA